MPKDRKKLDFHELVRRPGFEWVRLYFEKNYQNKNFIIEPILLNKVGGKKDGVYYLTGGEILIHPYSYLDKKRPINRGGFYLFNNYNYPSVWSIYAIKITVI